MARKDKRQAIKTLLETNTTLQAVYDHEVKDFRRVSPIATVHSDGSLLLDRDASFEDAFIISLWWKRSTDGGDTEDALDDLADEVRALILSSNDVYLDDSFSQMGYPVVDGVMYRQERIRVTVL
jgi:hypothetical protein